jgi:hypothetical protein
VVGFIIAAVAVVVISVAYTAIQPRIDLLHFRAAACACTGLLLGLVAALPIRVGRVRKPLLAAVIGTLLGLLALYVVWIAFIHHVIHILPVRYMLLRPIIDLRVIRAINHFGTWRFHGDNVNTHGPILSLFWVAEALVLLGGAVAIPINALYTSDPVCNDCGSRSKRAPSLPRFADTRQDEFLASVDQHDFAAIATHAAAKSFNDPELSLRLMCCPNCGQLNVLTVNRIAWTRDSRGRARVKTTPLIDQILITPAEAEELKSVCHAVSQQRQTAESPASLA